MTTGRLIIVMFLVFIVEGTLVPWFIPDSLAGRIIPHFTFILVMYTALYAGRHKALLLGLIFGLLQDVVYFGNLLGVHSFAMGLLGYLTGLLLDKKRVTMMSALSVIILACMAYESILYAVYRVFRFTRESYPHALMEHMVLSTFLQLGFALAIYVPVRRWMEKSGHPVRKPENEEE
ncbi:rod shape-determining protein MreD [Paenibacillus kobensis]|uniref:rod shape-determining protein MreD n=1 Tax=Paenibacillus kobensis TaxID=59841 RepID=UPI000FD6F215|nr:rod shape-determining protein MreD [Paenibacillus kobensis]